jgi:hypothetical protein
LTWIEVTDDEARAARIAVKALTTAGLKPDPLVVAIATAEPHTEEWITRHGGSLEATNEISEAMDRGLRSMAQEREVELRKLRRLRDAAFPNPPSTKKPADRDASEPDYAARRARNAARKRPERDTGLGGLGD